MTRWQYIGSISLVTALIIVSGNFISEKYLSRETTLQPTPTRLMSPSPLPAVTIISQPTQSLTPSPRTPKPTSTSIPPKLTIDVPFLVQAPLVNWDQLHEEACEEASLIMVTHFYQHTTIANAESGEKEIQDLVAYETAHGYDQDVTMAELNQIAADYYSFKGGRIETASINSIKQELAYGRPVIVPAAGRLLPNPNFKQPGPIYHMLVVKGYDSTGFITNDPGTRKGKDFHYTYDALFNAIHDWNTTNILNGEKKYLVFD